MSKETVEVSYRIVIEDTCEVTVDRSLPMREQQLDMASAVAELYDIPSFGLGQLQSRVVSSSDVDTIAPNGSEPFRPDRWTGKTPPDEAWIAVGTEWWATDGTVLVMKGGPCLGEPTGRKWRQGEHIVNAPHEIAKMLDADGAVESPKSMFNAVYAPLLAAGKVVSTGLLKPHQVLVDGRVVAVVMPMNDWHDRTKQIYADGSEVTP